ncbi:3-oxoacyl-[acyl-carrier protein] reductase [Mumia flava]|uniref:3-oxoacyl-[acyl-carrier protein] reductase n=1 Tax=Mumia flava TaxID=1348852 RepID=A0A0B2BPW3_9ACTN|nr:3-oxoacyl-ACP reductase [Mumia flava]PJJ53634.1 3-oxoacyl-[acyl-carrier protein] reductase [Mumia flava]
MSDRYQDLAHTPVGKFLVNNLGLPNPPRLERWTPGAPVVDGTVLVAAAEGSTLAPALDEALAALGVATTTAVADEERVKGIVVDATGIDTPAGLDQIQQALTPVLRSLSGCGRVVLLGTPPSEADTAGRAIAQRALEGISRSLGKELGKGSTAQTVYVAGGAERAIASTLAFLLSPKSAYVCGQVVRIGSAGIVEAPEVDLDAPLAGKVALVTGASRGLGLAMAQTLHRDGAAVIGLDVAPLADDLQRAMASIDGESIVLDITAPDAPQRIASYLAEHHGGVDVVVHNAGITRDKRLRNMKTENWHKVVEINVDAPARITAELLEAKLIRPGGSILGVSSIAGIAGNNGQTNYAASKAGVIGWVDELAPRVAADQITINAVAPGFIETDMVKTIPLTIREAGRRMNSMAQGGLPIDVAEAVAWFANPASAAVSGNVVRVCGQSLLGA